MKRAVISCGGGNRVGELCDMAAYEMVRQNLADKKVCTGKFIKGEDFIVRTLNRYDQITILEACSSLCVSEKIIALLPEKNIQVICLPRQGFTKDNIKDVHESLDILMAKLHAYFQKVA